MKRKNYVAKVTSSAVVICSALSFTQHTYAMDPFTTALLVGGTAVVVSHHSRKHHAYLYTPITSRSVYGYASPYRQRSIPPKRATRAGTVRLNPGVRWHACGYDGICLGQ